jgi:Uncharacterized protein conserved in bacteria (DUF2330)
MRHPHRTIRGLTIAAVLAAVVVLPAASAFACGALLAPNGTISLQRTTTLAAYHDGIEHYVTSFEYGGKSSGDVGSIIPLPGVPTRVIKGGDWTLQRLVLETQPQPLALEGDVAFAAASPAPATVILQRRIAALDVTVLEGGATAVGQWAQQNGFFLPPDAPAVLDFYAQRSPVFLAVKFNAERAQRQGIAEGEGIPVHVVIPTPNPWVPLRILTLGQQPDNLVQADVYLLTDRRPATLPQAERSTGNSNQRGMIQEVSESASQQLLRDLGSDAGMKWLPQSGMWLTYLKIDTPASQLTNDLAIDASGYGHPNPVAAGFPASADEPSPGSWRILAATMLAALVVAGLAVIDRRRRGQLV